jgi:hypothetical protein
MKIFELKQKQAEALEALQWCCEEEGGGEYQQILDDVQGAVQNKLDYWLPLLQQAKFDHDQAVEAKRRYVAAHDANIKRKEKVMTWIKDHVLTLMVDFGIEKHKGELFNCSHYLSPGSLQFGDTFRIEALAKPYTKTIVEPNKDAITKRLKELDEGEQIVKDVLLPGCYLVKKETLRVS